MIRDTFGEDRDYAVRWDAYETKIDVVGSLTLRELDHLILVLQTARAERKDEPDEQPATNA